MASGAGSAVAAADAGREVAEGLVVDPAHPDTMTMTIATTRDLFDAEPVVAISWLILCLLAGRRLLLLGLMIGPDALVRRAELERVDDRCRCPSPPARRSTPANVSTAPATTRA